MRWIGTLFAVHQEDNTWLVGLSLPSGGHAQNSFLAFEGSGPLPPTGFPEMVQVPDLQAWMSQKRAEGLSFQQIPWPPSQSM